VRVSVEVGDPRVECPPPTPTPLTVEPALIAWDTRAQALDASAGVLAVRCPAGGADGPLWGTDLFTDDSSVCAAALHSGLVTRAEGGVVRVVFAAGAPQYRGSARNGVRANPYGAFRGSFSFVGGPRPGLVETPLDREPDNRAAWRRTLTAERGHNGSTHTIECPPDGTLGTVWGTDVYTDDSSVCSAAVHAGLVTLARGGTVVARITSGRPRYRGTVRHEVTSQDYHAFDGSFTLARFEGPSRVNAE
jgi:hypothetical protein